MDVIDFMKRMSEEVFTGTYYSIRPKLATDRGIRFEYDIVDDSDKTYSTLLNTLQTERAVMTIKTDDDMPFKVKGYVVTQDGTMWQITGVIVRPINKDNKQSARIVQNTIQTAKIIRLIGVENPWGLK